MIFSDVRASFLSVCAILFIYGALPEKRSTNWEKITASWKTLDLPDGLIYESDLYGND